MKLKITRIFCVFLLIVASIAFALLFTLLAEEEALDRTMWFGMGGFVLVSLGYAALLLNNWVNADKLLIFAGVYAVILLLLINVLGLA